jgi:hypothetical protein
MSRSAPHRRKVALGWKCDLRCRDLVACVAPAAVLLV